MKKLLILIVVLTSFCLVSAKEWIPFDNGFEQEPQVNIVESDDNRLILDINVSGMYLENITANGETFQKIELIENQTTHDVGMPELPMITRIVGIPDNQLMRVRVLESTTNEMNDFQVYPLQTPEKDGAENNFEFVKNAKFYNSNETYPEINAFVDNVGIWRDVKIGGFHFIPFRYNAAGNLEITTSARIEIEFYGFDNEMVLTKDKVLSPSFYNMYDSALINFDTMGYEIDNNREVSTKYLIVTNTSALASIQPFVDYKNKEGYAVEVRVLETGFETAIQIKDYILSLYASDDLEYVLLVGDAYPNGSAGPDNVPMYLWSGGGGSSWSDSWYSCLDGNTDYYADIAIGRITYDTIAELDHQMLKLTDFYDIPDQTTNWGENSILVAHSEQYPQKYTLCKQQINDFPYAIQTPIFDLCYGGAGANNNDIINWVNTTSGGIFNYRGHGSATEFWQWGASGSFTATHVNQLTNDNRNFVLFDVCCDNMDIVGHAGDCLAESFMKADEAAIAINGAIVPSYTIPNHDYDKEMYKAIFNEGITNIGYITNYANIFVVNLHGNIGICNVLTYLWLGDSSIEPWTMQIQDLTVTHDTQLFLGTSTFDVTVMGSGGPMENAAVCVSNDDGSIYAVAYTDAGGVAQIQFDSPVQSPGTAHVTAKAFNYLMYQMDIPVIPQTGPYCVFNDYTINDATGNGNGMLDYGESVLLTLDIENVGVQQADNVTVEISTTDAYITITDGTEVYGNIAAGSIVSITDGFAFDVAGDVPDGHYVMFDVTATSGANTWDSSFSTACYAPVLTIGGYIIDDATGGNNNGRLDPGETITLTIPTNNEGSSASPSAIGVLTCTDPLITIETATYTLGVIAAGGSVDAVFTLTADASISVGSPLSFMYGVVAGEYIIENNFAIVVGLILEDFETNNFESFEWEFGGNANWLTAGGAYEGSYCAQSGDINNSQSTSLYMDVTVLSAGDISFYKKVSSESNYDYLRFFVDNTELGSWSGTVNWSEETYAISAGDHIFKWQYDKDSSVSSGSDCAWIDYIIFPPIAMTAMGTISGLVTDSVTGLPIEGVDVAGITVTAADGSYSFDSTIGVFDFPFSHEDYYEFLAENISVLENETTTLDVSMMPLPEVDPPNNFAAEIQDYNDVLLTWEFPGGASEEILYHSGYDNNGIGTNGVVDFICCARFTAEELAAYYGGWSITGVNIFLHSMDFSYAGIKVYEGGSLGNPGTVVYDQDITSSAVALDWTNHLLTTPVPLVAGNEYWIGYDLSATADHPAAVDMGPMVPDKGAWMFYSGAWDTLAGMGLDYNWVITGIVSESDAVASNGTKQSAVIGSNKIQERTQALTSSAPFEAEYTRAFSRSNAVLTNENSRALIGYIIYRDGTEIAEIFDPATLLYVDEGLSAGNYVYTIVAVYDEGESDPAGPVEVMITLPAPNGLTLTSNWPNILCTWTAMPGVQGYNLYQDAVLVTNTTSTFYLHANVSAGDYIYNIAAVFNGGWEGEWNDNMMVQHYPIGTDPNLIPQVTELEGNYPNPFNPTTSIKFAISEPGYVTLEVYNIKGEKVRTLVDGEMAAQFQSVIWDGKDSGNKPVSSGVYFYKMKTGKYTSTKKMILMK